MSKLGTANFTGKSGSRYRFDIYPLDVVLDKGLEGVYVVTRRKRRKTRAGYCHVYRGAGHSADLSVSLANGQGEFSAQGANCFCVHLQEDARARQDIERDLVRGRSDAPHADQAQRP